MPLGVVAGSKTRSEPHLHPGELSCRDSGRLDVSRWVVVRPEAVHRSISFCMHHPYRCWMNCQHWTIGRFFISTQILVSFWEIMRSFNPPSCLNTTGWIWASCHHSWFFLDSRVCFLQASYVSISLCGLELWPTFGHSLMDLQWVLQGRTGIRHKVRKL